MTASHVDSIRGSSTGMPFACGCCSLVLTNSGEGETRDDMSTVAEQGGASLGHGPGEQATSHCRR